MRTRSDIVTDLSGFSTMRLSEAASRLFARHRLSILTDEGLEALLALLEGDAELSARLKAQFAAAVRRQAQAATAEAERMEA